jgi:TRAP-type C4-dicarboxylate transport system substrate-binding protein
MAREKNFWQIMISVTLLVVLVSNPSYAADPVIKWKAQSAYNMPANVGPFQNQDHGTGNIAIHLARWFERETKGNLKMEVAVPGAIVPVGEMFKAVTKGVIDVAGPYYGGFHTGLMPETDIEIGLPFAWERPEEAWDAYYNRGLIDEFKKIYAEHNIYFLPFIVNTAYSFGTTFDCPGLDALKGKKIRALGIYGELVKAFGATPVVLPGTEMYMGLKLGTIDGAIFGLENIESYKLKEVWKNYVYSPNPNVVVVSFLINLDSWNKLPAETRRLIDDNAKYVLLSTTMNDYAWDQYWATKSSKEYPFKLVYWSAEDVAKARRIGYQLWDSVAKKSDRCARLVGIVKQQMKDLGKME